MTCISDDIYDRYDRERERGWEIGLYIFKFISESVLYAFMKIAFYVKSKTGINYIKDFRSE